ncbi:hypothetical protein [Luteimonas sp. TWI875]|uniref:hypothetical protein n=2 Tax=unclassified Luteimonas TaxID=2629088 RepID=UPI003209107D
MLATALAACSPGAAPTLPAAATAPTPADTTLDAHAALAMRLRPFLIERGTGPSGRNARAADDERFRLGAFWKARTDTHHFDAAFRARAQAALSVHEDGTADAALRRLLATVEARLPAWQALVDYNASGQMRDDGGDGGRALLPDAIEAAAWAYVETVTQTEPAP